MNQSVFLALLYCQAQNTMGEQKRSCEIDITSFRNLAMQVRKMGKVFIGNPAKERAKAGGNIATIQCEYRDAP